MHLIIYLFKEESDSDERIKVKGNETTFFFNVPVTVLLALLSSCFIFTTTERSIIYNLYFRKLRFRAVR